MYIFYFYAKSNQSKVLVFLVPIPTNIVSFFLLAPICHFWYITESVDEWVLQPLVLLVFTR
jgi:hypothetical protein